MAKNGISFLRPCVRSGVRPIPQQFFGSQTSNGESGPHAALHLTQVAIAEMTDDRQFRTMHGEYVRSEIRLRSKPGILPVVEKAVRGRRRFGRPGGENADEDIRAFDQVCATRNHHRRTYLGFDGAGKHADNDIAGLQREPSESSVSSRFKEALLKSRRSSSDQESDQSILQFGVTVASRSASADNSAAVSGARRRYASTNDASRGFSCISMVL